MNERSPPDWDPKADAVRRDQRTAFDAMRERCPVAHSDLLGWSLFRHQDVVQALNDPATFSSSVSAHPAVPNGMDPPEHTEYRRVIEPYFRPDRMQAFEPRCRRIAVDLVRSLLVRDEVEFIGEFTQDFALRVQCDFLGWPVDLRDVLRLWTQKNDQARLAQDRALATSIAQEFEAHVLELLRVRREAGPQASDDLTTRLLQEQVWGRPLRDAELVSILRNWTVGEIGTISASVGILAHHLSEHADLQDRLRAQPEQLPEAIDEILRLHPPLVANRRVTTRPVTIGGRPIGAGERISLNWMAANRDGRVFEDPQAFRFGRDPAANLLYGQGIHVCPGAPLARMELLVVMQELLARTSRIEPATDQPPTRAPYPASGFGSLHLRIRRAA